MSVLHSEPLLRDYVWKAFFYACDCALQPKSKLVQALESSNRSCLLTLSSRVVPQMISTYIQMHAESKDQDPTRSAHSRLLALESLLGFARLSDVQLVSGIFKTLVARLLKAVSCDDDA